jgi:hypothetical protein
VFDHIALDRLILSDSIASAIGFGGNHGEQTRVSVV